MGQIQLGSGVGTVVGPASNGGGDDDKAGAAFGPDSAAGQALWIAVAGFVLLLATVGRSQSGAVAKVGAVLEFVAIVTLAGAVGQWAARSYAGMHPDGPFAAGVRFDL